MKWNVTVLRQFEYEVEADTEEEAYEAYDQQAGWGLEETSFDTISVEVTPEGPPAETALRAAARALIDNERMNVNFGGYYGQGPRNEFEEAVEQLARTLGVESVYGAEDEG